MDVIDVYGRERLALVTAGESAALDRRAREVQGLPERVLMENAGRSAAQVLNRLHPRGPVVAVVGSGHNGGDALVLLRTLRAWGREVAYVPVGSRAPDPALAHGFEVDVVSPAEAPRAFARAGVLVDGILGTGARGAPREPAAGVIRAMNASGRPVVALDLPSGVDATTGAVPGVAVDAAVTVTFGWPKQGLLLHPARERCGRLVAVEIGFPPLEDAADALERGRPGAQAVTPGWARARLPARPPDAHKGTAGRLFVLAGRRGMAGAAALVGRGAVRAGVGLVHLCSGPENREVLQARVPEAVFAAVGTDDADAFAGRSEAVLAGPGMGTDDDARQALEHVLEHTRGRPTLLDADALTLLSRADGGLARVARERPLVITPHPGEFRRITGRTIAEIRAAPLDHARELAEEIGAVVLLKGQPSVVAAPGEPVLVSTVGSSDLATAGMGDLLAGVIGAFLAAGTPVRTAAALGLFYTARAADLAGMGRALSPLDVADHLHHAFRHPGADASALGLPFVTFDQPPRW